MAATDHALLGPSKAHQWIACPPSALWETEFPDPGSSEAAAEGTLAHAIAEDHLLKALTGKRQTTLKAHKEDPLYKPAMQEHVATYVDYVMELRATMPPDVTVSVETRLDLTRWVPDCFGTADCILVDDGKLHVCDFKYGKGVPVDAKGNPQLRLYALGCLDEFGVLYDIDTVTTHIIQPRLDSITSETLTVEELRKWGEEVVKPAAALAAEGKGDFNPGEDQCRWCRCKNRCRAYMEYVTRIAALRFDPVDEHERQANELTDEEIGQILSSADELKRWASGIAEWALDQATTQGTHFPGWKLVAGRSVRKITDEDQATLALMDAGFKTTQILKLKGLTDLEALAGKARLENLLKDLIVKPEGKPTLVRESDKRPALAVAANEVFTAVND
jgi:hypothetical protein